LGPALARGDDVEVAVQVDEGVHRPSPAGADDVDARMLRRVLLASFRGVVLDLEVILREPFADEPGAVLVRLAGRIDGWDADQLGRERPGLVARLLDLGEYPIRHVHSLPGGLRPAGPPTCSLAGPHRPAHL